MIETIDDVETLVYRSYMRIYPDIPRGLDRDVRHPEYTRHLLDAGGALDREMNNILVTGSKGKGSVSLLLASCIHLCGYRGGLFTSPHLQTFRERIRVDGRAVPEDALIGAARRLEEPFMALESGLPQDRYLGPVGMAGVLAVDVFSRAETDVNVIELGRGARFDDVAQIHGRWALINRVFPEHTDNLGETLEDVAWNKAGVIQPGMAAAFSGRQDPRVLPVLQQEADHCGVPLYVAGRDFRAEHVRVTLSGTVFDYVEGDRTVFRDLTVGLLGRHQADNGALALFAARKILDRDVPEAALQAMWPKLRWFGRMEILARNPFTLLDGCINRDCIPAVLEVASLNPGKPVVSVVGIPEEKDYLGVCQALDGACDVMILTHAANDFLKFSPEQVDRVRRFRPDVLYVADSAEACREACRQAGKDGTVLYVGTQSLIKDVKSAYGQSTLDVFSP